MKRQLTTEAIRQYEFPKAEIQDIPLSAKRIVRIQISMDVIIHLFDSASAEMNEWVILITEVNAVHPPFDIRWRQERRERELNGFRVRMCPLELHTVINSPATLVDLSQKAAVRTRPDHSK